MAVPAKCVNCANDPQPHPPNPPQQPPANLGVVLGVLGGCALVALVVAIIVPLVRRRGRRAGSILSVSRSLYRRVLDGDLVERNADAGTNTNTNENTDGLYLPSRRPSIRHQKLFAGPDAQPLLPLLLDPLRPISALTWSDLRTRSSSPHSSSSTGTSADTSEPSMQDEDEYRVDPDAPGAGIDRASSLSTNRATTSHRSSSSRSTREREHERASRRDEHQQGRLATTISDHGQGAAAARSRALPLPPRSPTPPGLPSKFEYRIAAARRASLPLPLPITPTSPSDSGRNRVTSGMPALYAPVPSTSTSLVASAAATAASPGLALARHPSGRHRAATHKPGMEPVLEDSPADAAYAETRSLQLPSPPASPEQRQPMPQWHATSAMSSASASASSASRRRPSLTASQSAPTATTSSHRPRSSTGPAIPLTAAFQTSVLRSGSQSTASSGAATSGHRYPSIVTSPPLPSIPGASSSQARTRPSSVSVGQGALLSPESPDMSRPTESFRRMSTTDIRHRRPAGPREDIEARATLRATDVARTTQVQAGSGSGYDSRVASLSFGGPTFTTPPPLPLASPPALSPTPPRLSVSVHGSQSPPTSALASAPSSWRASGSLQQQQQQQYQQYQQQQHHQHAQQHGPALVRRKDSAALRPLPVSALMSPGPGVGVGVGVGGSRSRSNSVRSTRAGSVSGMVQLPPLDPITPLTLSLQGSSEEEQEEERRRR
ncbi:hypothetical protein C8Q77DRAFT_1281004 [Trametes polyzona]|nr:hypothetical protein C8Q77DRAFT_1281004 [Trametes polyzona]